MGSGVGRFGVLAQQRVGPFVIIVVVVVGGGGSVVAAAVSVATAGRLGPDLEDTLAESLQEAHGSALISRRGFELWTTTVVRWWLSLTSLGLGRATMIEKVIVDDVRRQRLRRSPCQRGEDRLRQPTGAWNGFVTRQLGVQMILLVIGPSIPGLGVLG